MQEPTAPARTVFFAVVLASLAGAVVGSVAQEAPQPVPDYALNSPAIYHVEIALALFIGAYVAVAVAWLSYQGRAFTKLSGPGGIGAEAEALTDATSAIDDALERLRDEVLQHVAVAVDDLDRRVTALEWRRP